MDRRNLIRGAALALAASALLMSVTPAATRAADVQSVLTSAGINDASATGAPQQQVVNGWAVRDLIALQIDRSDVLIAEQQRTNRLMVVTILALALSAVSLGTRPTPQDSAVTSAHAQRGRVEPGTRPPLEDAASLPAAPPNALPPDQDLSPYWRNSWEVSDEDWRALADSLAALVLKRGDDKPPSLVKGQWREAARELMLIAGLRGVELPPSTHDQVRMVDPKLFAVLERGRRIES